MTDIPEHQRPLYQDDEITLKELILKIQEYWGELWKNWLLIGLICVPFVAYKLYDAFTSPVVYPGTLTFMVDEDEGNRLSPFARVLGQVGLGGGGTGKYNLDKILEISKSRRVLQMALFSKSKVQGKEDYLANHLIRQFEFHEKWEDDTTGMKDFLYTDGDVPQFSKNENRALKALLGLLNGNEDEPGIYATSYDEDTGIMSLGINGRSEDLTINFLDTMFHRLRSFYVEKTIEKSESTYTIIKEKTDSLAQELSSAEYSLAQFMDRNRNVYSVTEGQLQQSRLTAQVTRLQTMYGEALKNLQISELNLQNKEPFITLIDSPLSPIKAQVPSKLMALIIGGILGCMVGVTFVLGRKVYRDAMA